MTLNIELSYLHMHASDYVWLNPLINNAIQGQFNINTRLVINQQPISQELVSDQTNDSQLQDFIAFILPRSRVRQDARANGEWYVHLLVASYHDARILGNMYDAAIAINSRNGCAIYMSELMDLSHRDGVPLNLIVGRTVLHELGHCLALIHNTDRTIMSETNVLIQSTIPPRWYGNINYQYNPADINFIHQHSDVAQPGGRIIERTGTVSDEYLSSRGKKGIHLELLTFDMEPNLNFILGDIITLCIKITNISKRIIKLPFPLHQNSRDLVVTLSRPDGETVRLDLQKGCCSGLNSISVKINEYKIVSLNLFADKTGYIFKTPGIYRIECFIRTFGEGGGWHSSGLRDIFIQPATEERQLQIQKIHTKKLLTHAKGGGFKPLFNSAFFKMLNHLQNDDPRSAVPLCWMAVNYFKNVLVLSANPNRMQKAKMQLLSLYEFLSINEPFKIRRGKILYDLKSLRQEGQLKKNMDSTPELVEYVSIKGALINRKPIPQIKKTI